MLHRIGRFLDVISILVVLVLIGGSDNLRLTGSLDRARVYTREIEFDYPNWVWDAAWTKIEQAAVLSPYTFDRGTGSQIVFEYFRVTGNLAQTEYRIEQIYADPNIADKETATSLLRSQRDVLTERQIKLAPLTESILQNQVSNALAELGLTTMGQPIPPVLYQISPTPLSLIVASRTKIEQITSVSVLPTLTIDEQIALEDEVASSLDVSTLVVPVGGVGVYPTLIQESTNFAWILTTIAHEWTHNYLNVRPLGLNYSTTPELRTMNETTANIAGDEVGYLVLQMYYPELAASFPNPNLILFNGSYPSERTTLQDLPGDITSQGGSPLHFFFDDPPPFDFRAEMHETRVTVDEMLTEGKIEEAEAYMEARRQVFWENGYLIRKLNQAFFAFNGAYADVPGGAAGEDPVGPAVRALREQSVSLKDFMNTIGRMTSFEQLQKAIQQ